MNTTQPDSPALEAEVRHDLDLIDELHQHLDDVPYHLEQWWRNTDLTPTSNARAAAKAAQRREARMTFKDYWDLTTSPGRAFERAVRTS